MRLFKFWRMKLVLGPNFRDKKANFSLYFLLKCVPWDIKVGTTHKNFDACYFAGMLLEALCMLDTAILHWGNRYFQDFAGQHPEIIHTIIIIEPLDKMKIAKISHKKIKWTLGPYKKETRKNAMKIWNPTKLIEGNFSGRELYGHIEIQYNWNAKKIKYESH